MKIINFKPWLKINISTITFQRFWHFSRPSSGEFENSLSDCCYGVQRSVLNARHDGLK